ncbi:hypothetical protein HS088_TW16G00205 [Tripterygium wilfordii]|uniref:Uncharacterized protein n=1 Tax=Tripterygium wilfordii TaxID=458696 RepID=A0A7J7CI74_TRIWF|nr:hypothetical protein HS088_TW16G00205 [Tripterygium wilfordii]
MEEDTLSLSELPLTNSDSSWKEYSARNNQSSSSFDDDDGLFEFFSGDIAAAAASSYPADKIIFCGEDIANNKEAKKDRDADKIIFCGKDIANNKEAKEDREAQSEQGFNTTTKAMKSSLSFNRVGATTVTSSRHQEVRNQRILLNCGYITNKQAEKYGLSMLTTLQKPRWYFFVFGIGRHSMEMEQRAIKTRQSRKGSVTMFHTVEKGEVIKGKGRRSGEGSWGFLRMLGCTDKRAVRVVKATLVCMPEVQSNY